MTEKKTNSEDKKDVNVVMNSLQEKDEKEKAKKPNYKIWHFGKSRWDKVVVERFWAESDEKALERLEEVKKSWNGNEELFWSTVHYTCVIDDDGEMSDEVDIDDGRKNVEWLWGGKKKKKKGKWWKRAWEEVAFFFEWWLVDRPKDFWWWMKDLVYLLKNGERRSAQWSLDWHLLDSIERNVPKLIENSHCLAFIDEAIMKLHGDEEGFDLDKFLREHCSGYPEEVEKLAVEIQREEYEKLLQHVKLYRYYSDMGHGDFDDPEWVELDKKWRGTLPLKRGTWDEIEDWKKLVKLAQDEWEAVWEWMKKHGQKLND